jgi:nonsense-mediated mRNA decay protein 3
VTVAPRVEVILCPVCGARKSASAWADTREDRGRIAHDAVMGGIRFHPDVQAPSVQVRITDRSSNRSTAHLEISARLFHTPLTCCATMEILWRGEQCDRCSRISGGYYEGVVQVRAERRQLSTYEKDTVARIACDVERQLLGGGERLSFVSRIDELKEGMDIVVGTQHLGQVITSSVTAALGGRFSTHPKLVGEKNGRPLYRITYSLRLPYYQRGDVIRLGRSYVEVRDVEQTHLRVFDLANGTMRAIREEDAGGWIGNVREAREAVVAFADAAAVCLVEPWTHTTREVLPVPWLPLAPGGTVRVLQDTERETIVLVG